MNDDPRNINLSEMIKKMAEDEKNSSQESKENWRKIRTQSIAERMNSCSEIANQKNQITDLKKKNQEEM